ncbi:alkaline phosphatase, tissue-nonspecific isozyme-like isoform X1 [Mytilus trossulus]|uniref:alkaline phosphatase, tissue-nonspecific isozyme-like isoform X1 n=1 Tax=Mytilus trossulus TaxID=6551 RepID=UPI003006D10E
MMLLTGMLFLLSLSSATDWNKIAKDSLKSAIKRNINTNVAKNVILFIGDGMGMSTITASRIYKGQKQGRPGEETVLKFEEFPHVALSKVYGVDRQVPDSAQTATALMGGVKTNVKVLGYTEDVKTDNCSSESITKRVYTILDHFQNAGRGTGIVTTARLTHATPAAAYAHTAQRNWENDKDMIKAGVTGDCTDIAYQLVNDNYDIQVAMGGGRRNFLPNTTFDPEYGRQGKRQDGIDLIERWKEMQSARNRSHQYVWNNQQFDSIDPMTTDYVLGLFENSHMQYEVDRNRSASGEPSISEMTEKAINILKRNTNGFFLMVEGGRIDHAHHDTKGALALEETLAFEEAISTALEMTDNKETLIIVTADHSHVFTIGGYTNRGNDILGLVEPFDAEPSLDGMPYTTLSYGNGPGTNFTAGRQNLSDIDTRSFDYIQQSAVPLKFETHSGEDVPIFASGPVSYLIHGVQEQHYVAHVMQYAACVGDYTNDCDRQIETVQTCAAFHISYKISILLISFLIYSIVS